MQIINYKKEGQIVTLIYNNNKLFDITTGNLICIKFGQMLGKFTPEYKYNIGDIVLVRTGNIKILDQIRVGQEKRYVVQCLNCNAISKKNETGLKNFNGCSKCNDGISYPEKFFLSLLNQLNIQYIYQKQFKWSNRIRYDFYIPHLNCIIETNGNEHYNKKYKYHGNTYIEVHKQDIFKKELAINNNIKYYIELDCRKSESNFIKSSIMNSKLSELFNLYSIDFNKCHTDSCFSYIKIISDLWNSGIKSHKQISPITGLKKELITKYLNKATQLGLCNYTQSEMLNATIQYNGGNCNCKKILCITTGEIFDSIKEATEKYNIYRTGLSDYLGGKKVLKSMGTNPITKEKLTWKYLT